MANKDEPKGFIPILPIKSMNVYPKGTATALYAGDAVIANAAGNIVVATGSSTEVMGVVAQYRAATATDVLLYDDPDQQYYIQDDGVGGTLAAADVGLNIDTLTTAGNATYLKSQMEADTNTKLTTTAQLRILGKHPDDSWGKQVRLRVVINEHGVAKKTAGL